MEPEKNVFMPTEEDVQQNRVYGILSYIGILFLVGIFCAKESPFARYHANQGLVLFIFEIAACIMSYFTTGILLTLIFGLISAGVSITCGVFAIIGIVNASKGICKPVPVVGGIKILK